MNSGSRASETHAHAYLVLEFQELVSQINFDPQLYSQVRTTLYALRQRDDAIALAEEFRRGVLQKYTDHQDSEFIITRRRPRFVPQVLLEDNESIYIKSGGGKNESQVAIPG